MFAKGALARLFLNSIPVTWEFRPGCRLSSCPTDMTDPLTRCGVPYNTYKVYRGMENENGNYDIIHFRFRI